MRKLPLVVTILTLSGSDLSAADFSPALQWFQTLGGSGVNAVVAAGADANGNLYIVGNTSSLDFPAAASAQPVPGGSPLVRIGSATGVSDKLYPPGLSLARCLAADPRNPSALYAGAGNAIFQSLDAGSTWSRLSPVGSAALVLAVAVDPSNGGTLYAATTTQGVLKSLDGGLTWNAIDSGIPPLPDGSHRATRLWIDPNASQVVFASTNGGLMRSPDGGASWAAITAPFFSDLAFDPFLAGTLYMAAPSGILKSTDDGQTFTALSSLPGPVPASALVADPLHAGVLFAGSAAGGIFQSADFGVTWTRKANGPVTLLAADPLRPVFYANSSAYGLVQTADGFTTTTPVGPPESSLRQILVQGANLFELAAPSNDVFAVKLDSNGNLIYATYFGGSADDAASAMAVAADGSVYVTGFTTSVDFPTTPGVYLRAKPGAGALSSFVFKLNADGTLGWSTYFADFQTTVNAIAVDAAGNAYLAGATQGNLATTSGAYQTLFQQSLLCTGLIGCLPGPTSAFISKLNPQGRGLVYSTYVASDNNHNPVTMARALVLDPAGNAWLGGRGSVVAIKSDGSAVLASTVQAGITIAALALDSSSNLYATGAATPVYGNHPSPAFVFPATPGAFQTAPQPAVPILPDATPGGFSDAFILKWDSGLTHILAATLLGGELADSGESLAIDPSGNVIVSGETDSKAFPTRAPFQTSFSAHAGFVAGFDPTLSHLLFSTYLGDERPFDARAAVLDSGGNILLAGSVLAGDSLVVANKIALPAAPAVRLDSVIHYASRLAAAIAPGQPIMVTGAGFRPDAQLLLDGAPLAPVLASGTILVAVMPDGAKTSGAYSVQIATGGMLSNAVLVPAAPASPGIYSVDGSGYGQGYILNSDGSLNSPANPASPGSAITILAAGEGGFTLDNGYTVTALTPSVFIGGFYANGIAGLSGPVSGLPGTVYQLSVTVPDPAALANQNPNLQNFRFPPQVSVKLVMGAVNPANFENSAAISQGGIVLNVK